MRDSIWVWWLGLIVVVGGLAAGIYYQYYREQPVDVPAASDLPTVEIPREAPQPTVDVPPPPAQPAMPLPPLEDSDEEVQGSLAEMFGEKQVEEVLVPNSIVRHFVVTVDNLTREKVAVQVRPVQPPSGQFVVSGPEDAPVIDPENYARYEPFVRLIEAADARQVAAMYHRLSPLFQQAYEDLGYPDGNFNARLVEVIDHLLETPEVSDPIKLVRPNVFYQFADETLEHRSAGQKLLIRMGSENAAVIKAKLRELREELIAQAQAGASDTPAAPQGTVGSDTAPQGDEHAGHNAP